MHKTTVLFLIIGKKKQIIEYRERSILCLKIIE